MFLATICHRLTSPVARVLSKRIVWFSIFMCLLVLLAAVVGITQQDVGVHAAQMKRAVPMKHAVSFPKHVPAPPHSAGSSHPGRMMPTVNVSPLSLSFTLISGAATGYFSVVDDQK
jgi:hypothetical protein